MALTPTFKVRRRTAGLPRVLSLERINGRTVGPSAGRSVADRSGLPAGRRLVPGQRLPNFAVIHHGDDLSSDPGRGHGLSCPVVEVVVANQGAVRSHRHGKLPPWE